MLAYYIQRFEPQDQPSPRACAHQNTNKQTNKITAVSVFKACALDHIILLGLTVNFNLTFLNI